jgi:hypothetical protein
MFFMRRSKEDPVAEVAKDVLRAAAQISQSRYFPPKAGAAVAIDERTTM